MELVMSLSCLQGQYNFKPFLKSFKVYGIFIKHFWKKARGKD